MNSNFQNMGGPRPQQVNPEPGGMQRNGGASTDVRLLILGLIQSQPIPHGWQQTIHPQQRVGVIHQIITGLQLVKPNMDLKYAISVASQFEIGEFANSPNQEAYNQACRQKLGEIQRTRQNQANMQNKQLNMTQATQMGLTPQQMQARGIVNNQAQMQPSLGMPQVSQPGQNLGIPMQQQMSQNQRLMQNGNPQDMQQQMQNGQSMQNMPRAGQPNRQFTPEEGQQIQAMFIKMMGNMSEQERLNMQGRVAALPPSTRQQMQATGVDPVQFIVRNQATQNFIAHRARRQQLMAQGLQNQGNGSMAPDTRPPSQISMQGQQPPASAQQLSESAFPTGNLDQILGQQRDALRHQAAGQDVVPASNVQGVPSQAQRTPQQPAQGHFAANRTANPFQGQPQPQNQWNGQPNSQSNIPHTPQNARQAPTPNFASMQNQTPQQQALQGQLGGLNNGRAQRTSQQGHSMPTLNQPLEPPNQVKNNSSQKSAAQTPKQGQKSGTNPQSNAANNTNINTGQKNNINPALLQAQIAKLPPHFQEQFAKLPNDNARAHMLIQMSKKQQQNKLEAQKAQANAQAAAMSQSGSQQGVQGPTAGPRANQSNPQPIPTTNDMVSQPGINPFSQVPMQTQGVPQQQQQQQQGQPGVNRPTPQKPRPIALNEAQIRQMDEVPFPPNILNTANSLGQIPETVKTWRHLKEYVQVNAHSLPPQSMQNVVGLQSIHMQNLQQNMHFRKMQHMQQFQQMQQQQQQQQQQMARSNPQFDQTTAAPQATMVPQPLQNGMAPGSFPMPNLQPPTMHDLQVARQTLPPNMASVSDDQLRGMIMKRRQQEWATTNQQQIIQRNNLLQAQRLQQQQQQQQSRTGPAPPAPMQQPTRGQGQVAQTPQQSTQPQQTPKQPPQAPAQQAKQGQRAAGQGNAAQAGHKAPKRSTTDEVVEVPDPKIANQTPHPPASRSTQNNTMGGMSNMTQDDFNKLSPEQKAMLQSRMHQARQAQQSQQAQQAQAQAQQAQGAARAASGAKNGQNAKVQPPVNQNNNNKTEIELRFKRLKEEVEKSMLPRPVLQMNAKIKQQMIAILKDNTSIWMKRFDDSLPIFFRELKEEKQTKDLYRIRLLILQQFRDPSFTEPKDDFTIGLDELNECKKKVHGYLGFMVQRFAPGANKQPQANQSQPHQLNAANLQNLQQQEAAFNAQRVAAQKNQTNQSNKAPAAPTTREAPFNFGDHSPQGVPIKYADVKGGITQNDLKLPSGKRRKPNQAASPASTPAEAKNTPVTKPSPMAKPESPDTQRAAAVPTLIKCPEPKCQSSGTGFATSGELEKHRVEAHEPKGPVITDVEDAATYAIESLRLALNLDENGKSKTPSQATTNDKPHLQAPIMKTTASSQGQNATKQEVSTPMSRIPTQTGPSPASNALRTPQTIANMKTPASDSKVATKGITTKTPAADKAPSSKTPDPWATSNVSSEWFQEIFGDLRDLNRGVSPDFLTTWAHRNPISSDDDSPPDSSPEEKSDTPHKSDISANDELNINISLTDDLLDPEWFNSGGGALQDEMDALDVQDLMNMDLDAPEEDEAEDISANGKGKRRRDPLEASDEWLKFYAPEKLAERIKEEGPRKK